MEKRIVTKFMGKSRGRIYKQKFEIFFLIFRSAQTFCLIHSSKFINTLCKSLFTNTDKNSHAFLPTWQIDLENC